MGSVMRVTGDAELAWAGCVCVCVCVCVMCMCDVCVCVCVCVLGSLRCLSVWLGLALAGVDVWLSAECRVKSDTRSFLPCSWDWNI